MNPDTHQIQIAAVWRRALALLVDDVLVLIALLGLLQQIANHTGLDSYYIGYIIGATLPISVPVLGLYWALVFALAEWAGGGRTPGKRLFGIAVRSADGGKARFGQLLGRELLRALFFMLFVLPALIDGLSACWSNDRRCWHDGAAGTIVVRVRRARGTERNITLQPAIQPRNRIADEARQLT